MKNSFLILCLSFSFFAAFGQDGQSPATAFTDLGQVNSPGFAPGNYYFNLSGTQFSTYVDTAGWVLIASGEGANTTTYGVSTALTQQSNSILPATVYVGNATVEEIRISTNPSSLFDVRTNHPDELSQLLLGNTLSGAYVAGNHWTGNGVSNMGKSCPGFNIPLDSSIFHACGNFGGLHWTPFEGREELTFNGPDVDLDLWVKSAPVPIVNPIPTMSEWGIFLFGLTMFILGTVAVYNVRRQDAGKVIA